MQDRIISGAYKWMPAVLAGSLCLAAGGQGARAQAPGCFALEAKSGNASSRQVSLDTRVQARDRCEFAFDASGPWSSLGPIEDGGYADVALALATAQQQPLKNWPKHIYGRPKAADGQAPPGEIQSVFLAACSEFLLGKEQGFEMRVPVGTKRPQVRRSAKPRCRAEHLQLAFEVTTQAAPPALRAGPWSSMLPLDRQEISLDPGRWAVYATRSEQGAGLLIGHIESSSSETPLRASFHRTATAETAEPWLLASWVSGRLRLEPGSEALQESDRWAELRAAAAASLLWLARTHAQGGQEVIGRPHIDRGGRAIAVPSDYVAERMQQRYGEAGASMVPSVEDWKGLLSGLSLCLAARYEPTRLQRVGGAVPVGAQCLGLEQLLAPLSAHGGPLPAAGRICVKHVQKEITADGARAGSVLGERCADLSPGPGHEQEFMLATVGDQIIHAGSGAEHLYLCTDNRCTPVTDQGHWQPLQRAGLLEVRRSDSLAHASSASALTLLRLGVIDPARDWHPVGLSRGLGTEGQPWQALDRDEPDTFSFVPTRDRLDFRLATSPMLAAAHRKQGGSLPQLGQTLPRAGLTDAPLLAPRASALVTLATREGACPSQTAAELRAGQALVRPEELMVDNTFHIFLARYEGESRPYQCLARARFRVTENLSVPVFERLRVGLLGDAQLLVFLTDPAAIGVAVPAIYGRVRFGYGFGLDLSASLTGAVSFERGALSRAGLGVSAALYWGPRQLAPRLLSAGIMLHAAGHTDPSRPIASLYLGLNLATLVALAGGR